MRSSANSDDGGQAVVELALALPLVCLLTLGIAQTGLVVRDQMTVNHVAREAARAAAVSATPSGAARQAVEHLDLRSGDVIVETTTTAIHVTVRLRSPTDVPFIGALVPDAVLTSSVVMAREPP